MAKNITIGSVLKDKDYEKEGTRGYKRTYIKVSKTVSLKEGTFVNLVNPRKLADNLKGKVSEEVLAKIRERGEKTPAYVLFELQIPNPETQTSEE